MPGYNVMGICKAALDSIVKYLAYDLGPRGIRVNAVSAGPVRTLAGSAAGVDDMQRLYEKMAPLGRNITHEEVGKTGGFLLSDLSDGITGEILHLDGGYNIMGSPGPTARCGEGDGREVSAKSMRCCGPLAVSQTRRRLRSLRTSAREATVHIVATMFPLSHVTHALPRPSPSPSSSIGGSSSSASGLRGAAGRVVGVSRRQGASPAKRPADAARREMPRRDRARRRRRRGRIPRSCNSTITTACVSISLPARSPMRHAPTPAGYRWVAPHELASYEFPRANEGLLALLSTARYRRVETCVERKAVATRTQTW